MPIITCNMYAELYIIIGGKLLDVIISEKADGKFYALKFSTTVGTGNKTKMYSFVVEN